MSFEKLKITVVGFLASLFLVSLSANAKINPALLKKTTQHFKEEKKHLSPITGMVALNTRLLENLRFWGNVDQKWKDNIRNYQSDEGLDPFSKVIKILFPSVTGMLDVSTTSDTNFAKRVKSAKTIALILNYCHDLRQNKNVVLENLQEEIIGTLDGFERKEVPQEVVGIISRFSGDFLENKGQEKKNSEKKKKKKKKNIFQEKSEELFSLLQKEIEKLPPKTSTEISKIFSSTSRNKGLTQENLTDQITQVMKGAINPKSNNEKNFVKKVLKPLLKNIEESIRNEENSLYPTYSLEQAINGFFCLHFNTKNDIRDLLDNLDESIIDKQNLATQENFVKDDDTEDQQQIIQRITQKKIYSTEDFYNIWSINVDGGLPYPVGENFISNGSGVPCYNRTDKTLDRDNTFADCVETAVRHFCNFILWDPETRTFDLSSLEQIIDPNNPYFPKFREFYELQSHEHANNGEYIFRSLWNQVVADLNDPDTAFPIMYKRLGSNEIRSNFVNLVYILKKIFNLEDISKMPENDLDQQTRWLLDSMAKIVKFMSPQKKYQFNSKTKKRKDDSGNIDDAFLIGDLEIKEFKENAEILSFVFSCTSGHSSIKEYKTKKTLFLHTFDKSCYTPKPGTIEENMLFLRGLPGTTVKKHCFLYQIFGQSLSNIDLQLNFIKKLREAVNDKSIVFNDNQIKTLSRITGNMLKDISFNLIRDDLLNIFKNKNFTEVVIANAPYLDKDFFEYYKENNKNNNNYKKNIESIKIKIFIGDQNKELDDFLTLLNDIYLSKDDTEVDPLHKKLLDPFLRSAQKIYNNIYNKLNEIILSLFKRDLYYKSIINTSKRLNTNFLVTFIDIAEKKEKNKKQREEYLEKIAQKISVDCFFCKEFLNKVQQDCEDNTQYTDFQLAATKRFINSIFDFIKRKDSYRDSKIISALANLFKSEKFDDLCFDLFRNKKEVINASIIHQLLEREYKKEVLDQDSLDKTLKILEDVDQDTSFSCLDEIAQNIGQNPNITENQLTVYKQFLSQLFKKGNFDNDTSWFRNKKSFYNLCNNKELFEHIIRISPHLDDHFLSIHAKHNTTHENDEKNIGIIKIKAFISDQNKKMDNFINLLNDIYLSKDDTEVDPLHKELLDPLLRSIQSSYTIIYANKLKGIILKLFKKDSYYKTIINNFVSLSTNFLLTFIDIAEEKEKDEKKREQYLEKISEKISIDHSFCKEFLNKVQKDCEDNTQYTDFQLTATKKFIAPIFDVIKRNNYFPDDKIISVVANLFKSEKFDDLCFDLFRSKKEGINASIIHQLLEREYKKEVLDKDSLKRTLEILEDVHQNTLLSHLGQIAQNIGQNPITENQLSVYKQFISQIFKKGNFDDDFFWLNHKNSVHKLCENEELFDHILETSPCLDGNLLIRYLNRQTKNNVEQEELHNKLVEMIQKKITTPLNQVESFNTIVDTIDQNQNSLNITESIKTILMELIESIDFENSFRFNQIKESLLRLFKTDSFFKIILGKAKHLNPDFLLNFLESRVIKDDAGNINADDLELLIQKSLNSNEESMSFLKELFERFSENHESLSEEQKIAFKNVVTYSLKQLKSDEEKSLDFELLKKSSLEPDFTDIILENITTWEGKYGDLTLEDFFTRAKSLQTFTYTDNNDFTSPHGPKKLVASRQLKSFSVQEENSYQDITVEYGALEKFTFSKSSETDLKFSIQGRKLNAIDLGNLQKITTFSTKRFQKLEKLNFHDIDAIEHMEMALSGGICEEIDTFSLKNIRKIGCILISGNRTIKNLCLENIGSIENLNLDSVQIDNIVIKNVGRIETLESGYPECLKTIRASLNVDNFDSPELELLRP